MPKLKLLFICTHNVVRSRTAEDLLKNSPEYEARSAGIKYNPFGKQKITQDLIDWADRIFVMDNDNDHHKDYLEDCFNILDKDIHVLGIPDEYGPNDPKLVYLLKTKLASLGINI